MYSIEGGPKLQLDFGLLPLLGESLLPTFVSTSSIFSFSKQNGLKYDYSWYSLGPMILDDFRGLKTLSY